MRHFTDAETFALAAAAVIGGYAFAALVLVGWAF